MAAPDVPRAGSRTRHPIRTALRDALVVAVAAAGVALAVNGMRADGLPLVAAEPYQVLVPCPEPGGPVQPMAADDPRLGSERTFVVDARSLGEYEQGHLSRAVSLSYDWLDPVSEERLRQLAADIASSRATRVAVYGDGGRPDSGEHLGREISGRGIRNVFFVQGGAPALPGGGGP